MSTLLSLVNEATHEFKVHGIEDALLEARYLVSGLLGITATESLIRPECLVGTDDVMTIRQSVSRRCSHEPSAYIRGEREFYGRIFMIDARVLIPRPETELLVDLAIEHVRGMSRPAFIADVGTGSGNIGITLGLELPESAITAIDISEDALDVARTNAVKYRTGNVSFLCGNLLEPLPCSCDVIVANLPYVTDDEFISLPAEIVQYEPALALKGGPDGLRVIERLIIQCRNALNESGIILLEIGKGQRPMLSKMLEKYYPNCSIESFLDLNGLERVIKIKLSK